MQTPCVSLFIMQLQIKMSVGGCILNVLCSYPYLVCFPTYPTFCCSAVLTSVYTSMLFYYLSFSCLWQILCTTRMCVYLIRLMNIYKDSAESEAQRALSVITDLRAKIGELLLEWPEHPGLKQVIHYIWSCLAVPFLQNSSSTYIPCRSSQHVKKYCPYTLVNH